MNLTTASLIARTMLDTHGLTAQGWSFAFDNAKRRSGCCHYGTKTITVSRAITSLNDDASLRETMLHEIAHALVGHGHGHDRVWAAKCREIGGTAARCSSKGAIPTAPWTGVHDGCDITYPRHRRPSGQVFCPKCYRRPTGTSTFESLMAGATGAAEPNAKAAIRWVRTETLAKA